MQLFIWKNWVYLLGSLNKLFLVLIFMFIFRLRVLSSGIKSFELTNRNEKKDLQEIVALVSA